MNRLNRIGTVAALVAVSAVAFSQTAGVTVAGSEADAQKAIDARIAVFKQIKELNDPIGAMLRRQRPVDPALVATNAGKIAELGAKIPDHYLVDTRQFKGIKTGALDSIWASQADFKTKSEGLVKAATAAATAGKSGDVAATTAAIQGIGRSCGACHDSFRAKP